MIAVTAEQMRRMDGEALQKHGIPSLTLMENAGRRAFDCLQRLYPHLGTMRVCVITGKGNNAGDGFVVARYLLEVCREVVVLMAAPELRGDAELNCQAYLKKGGKTAPFDGTRLQGADLLIDALLGTGLSSVLSGAYLDVVSVLNRSGKKIVSLDVPSGLSSDTGEPMGEAVRAAMTLTMGLPKIGLIQTRAEPFVGRLEVIDIGLPQEAVATLAGHLHYVVAQDLQSSFSPRRLNTHKGSYGHLLAIGGSAAKPGAILMSGKAALRTGAGLVTVALPDRAFKKLSKNFLELMYETFPSTFQGFFRVPGTKRMAQIVEGKSAIMVGPGMGVNPGTRSILSFLLQNKGATPVVLDADALNVLAQISSSPSPPPIKGGEKKVVPLPWWEGTKGRGTVILTPHPGEMARLTGMKTSEVQKDRIGCARHFAQKWGVILVLKGFRTVMATPEGEVYVNSTGNPGMATAGMGDVLTGILGSLLAQGMPAPEAVVAGVFLHGRAGDRVADRLGDRGLVAMDLVDEIPKVYQELIK